MQPISSPPSAGRVGGPLVVVLAALAAVAPIATDLYLPGFPAIGADLGAGASGVQLSLTTFLAGLAVGQLVMGPLSDRYGRRRPLVASAAASVVAGAACALAPTLPVLVGARFVHGLAGAGGMVIGRAVVADLVSGPAAARAFTLMLTVGGVAPALSPLAGGLLAGPVGWRGMLWTVTALCAAMLAGVLAVVRETHPPTAGRHGGAGVVAGLRTAASRSAFRGPAAVFALGFGAMMGYIAASPFLYQNVMGTSAVGYGVLFGVNAVGLFTAGSLVARAVGRGAGARRVVRASLLLQATGTGSFLVLVLAGAPSWTFAVALFVAVAANGGILGTSSALAMEHVRDVAGSGSALLGSSQFALGGLVSPLVGLGGDRSALVPAAVMATSSALALLAGRRL